MTLRTEIMNTIAEQLDEMFSDHFEFKTVVVRYSGVIMKICDSPVEALKWLNNRTDEDLFIHTIGGNRF
jgi:hypothetical protein